MPRWPPATWSSSVVRSFPPRITPRTGSRMQSRENSTPVSDLTNRGSAGGRRRRARVACLQAMYRADVVGDSIEAVSGELAINPKLPEEIRAYASRLIALVAGHRDEIDAALKAALDRWELKRLAVLDRCVLRIGAAELL